MRTRRALAFLPVAFALAVFACGDDSSGANGAANGDGGANGDGAAPGDVPGERADGGDAGPVNPNPTISSFLGTNVGADLMYVDIAWMLSPWNGDTSTTDIGFKIPSGSYKVSFEGSGTLAVSGIGHTTGAWAGGRNTIDITGTPGVPTDFGKLLTLTKTGDVHDVHILMPGHDYGTTEMFLPEFLAVLAPFRALRFMDWESTNGALIQNWADRKVAEPFSPNELVVDGKHWGLGEPLENLAELVNVTGKDAWVTVPEKATADYIDQFATFLHDKLDMGRIQVARNKAGYTTPFKLFVENSNETWNGGFSAKGVFLAEAKKDAARYPGTYTGTHGPDFMKNDADLMKVGQYEADRLVKIANAFRAVFSKEMIFPVLAGWSLGTAYSDVGLKFIEANYGAPKDFISYVAHAPYFGAEGASLGELFTNIEADIASKETAYADFKALGEEYGISIVAYEGGQSLTTPGGDLGDVTRKHLAQHDQRMYDAYKAYLDLWKKVYGDAAFMHFSLADAPGTPEFIRQYGFWGSLEGTLENLGTCGTDFPTLAGTETVASVIHTCPKYHALAERVP